MTEYQNMQRERKMISRKKVELVINASLLLPVKGILVQDGDLGYQYQQMSIGVLVN